MRGASGVEGLEFEVYGLALRAWGRGFRCTFHGRPYRAVPRMLSNRRSNPSRSSLFRLISFPNPKGSEFPNSKVLGPKIHTLNGFWTLKPYYLGTWTLREWLHLGSGYRPTTPRCRHRSTVDPKPKAPNPKPQTLHPEP